MPLEAFLTAIALCDGGGEVGLAPSVSFNIWRPREAFFMYYVYLIKLRDSTIYTGSTMNLQARMLKHETGNVLATKGKRPLKMLYYCAFDTKKTALSFEKYLKTGSGQAFRNKHLIQATHSAEGVI